MLILVKELSWLGRETGNGVEEAHWTDELRLRTFTLRDSLTVISEQKKPVYYEYTLFLAESHCGNSNHNKSSNG